MFKTRNALLAALALGTVVTLSACSSGGMSGMDGMSGSGDSSSSSSPSDSATAVAGDFNDQDVMFAQMMKAHHEQAVEMSDMILMKDDVDQRVLDLATKIKAEQAPEIDTMQQWLTSWGADDSMSSMDHDMSGMMSDEDMSALESASGTDAAKLFLEQMTMHHEGAIEMAQNEVDSGQNPDAVALAESIVTSQSAELDEMKALLASL
ncbi:DUF305 domain-containing protein (plasmid) [Rathayibacter sp. VKM Ac-2759]|uniref:DUF305 domain-containing protein n=1 Tax=Rathayibacter sp. VKM Ac-2759 TaxID=2609252 RepID=UPI0013194F88|nr:DUF305 domain-containing protein [Rathayibacter sp. VKM Ac-2759]QHC68815.1 DUF305 domain-containing protein [Rathayibacter sp. VKM Ac-2759]